MNRAPLETKVAKLSRGGKGPGFHAILQAKYVEEDLRHGQGDLLDGRVWAGSEWDGRVETNEWLIWCRQVMHPTLSLSAAEESDLAGKLPIRHMESDEQALEFLARCQVDWRLPFNIRPISEPQAIMLHLYSSDYQMMNFQGNYNHNMPIW